MYAPNAKVLLAKSGTVMPDFLALVMRNVPPVIKAPDAFVFLTMPPVRVTEFSLVPYGILVGPVGHLAMKGVILAARNL